MGTDESGAIGPVSVRYAAQIRELLHAQALQRMAEAEEATRASAAAERAARVEPIAQPEAPLPIQPKAEAATPSPQAERAAPEKAEPVPAGQLVDVQA